MFGKDDANKSKETTNSTTDLQKQFQQMPQASTSLKDFTDKSLQIGPEGVVQNQTQKTQTPSNYSEISNKVNAQ